MHRHYNKIGLADGFYGTFTEWDPWNPFLKNELIFCQNVSTEQKVSHDHLNWSDFISQGDCSACQYAIQVTTWKMDLRLHLWNYNSSPVLFILHYVELPANIKGIELLGDITTVEKY